MAQPDILISAIAAMSENRVIGHGNKIPWHIPDDFKHFKRTTMGKPVIMGRKTFDSIGGKPLPGRPHIIITRQTGLPAMENVTYAADLDNAIAQAKSIATETGADEIFICGGAQIYQAALPYIEKLYLTIIHQNFEGDANFPQIDPQGWNETASTAFTDPIPYDIVILERRK